MKWSFRIATIGGTEVRVHATFFLLLLFIAMQAMGKGGSLAAAGGAVLLVCSMFLCVLLHEFGHVQAAKAFGIHTPDITLLPIGGVARLERMPRRPFQELVIAVCGPLVNVVIAAAIALVFGLSGLASMDLEFGDGARFWANLMSWNVLMVFFNMIPAFPMDGGRVLRAVLAFFTDYGKATRAAAAIGQSIAVVAFVWMLVSGHFNPFLMLIAFFIFIAAGQEAAMVAQQQAAGGLSARDAMLTDFRALPPHASLQDAVDLLLAGAQHDFPLLDPGGGMQGMLGRNQLIAALASHGPSHPASQVITACERSLSPDTSLSEAMEMLSSSPCPALPVLDAATGRLIGLITAENIAEALLVRSALQRR